MKKNLIPLVLTHDAVWAIEPQRGQLLWKQLSLIGAQSHREEFEAHQSAEIEARAGEGERYEKPFEMWGSVAVISVSGPMMKSPSSFSSNASTVQVRRQVRAAVADKEVTSILIRFDSPGGSVSGTQDLADEIAAANRKKECVAYIEDLCCSAAIWCASQCSQVYANATAIVGSIGTYMVVEDWSKFFQDKGIEVHVLSTGAHKGAGAFGAEIAPEQLAQFQQTVDDLNEHFLAAVSRGRSMTREKLSEIADGRVWVGEQAVGIGLVDAIATMDDVLSSMLRPRAKASATAESHNDFAEDTALPVGATFEQTLDSVLAAVEGANQRAEGLRNLRAGQGRMLGADRLKQLRSIHAETGALIERCASLTPAEDPSAAASPETEPAPESPQNPQLQALKEVLEASRSEAA
jgi:signal peptide peptidase SppA